MNRSRAILVTIITGLLAVAAPILFALHIADQQGKNIEKNRVLSFAREALSRSDRAADQIYEGIDRLSSAPDPCSPSQLFLMRDIDLSSSQIQAIGWVSNNILKCSSLGASGTMQIDLGDPDVVTTTGSRLRTNVTFPFAKDSAFTVVERNGYAAIIHKDLPIDVVTESSDISIATVTPENRKVRSLRGHINVEWMSRLGELQEVTFVEQQYVVAVVRSKRYATAVIAALPIHYLRAQTREAALILVPTGLAAGAVLIWAILYVVRLQMALPTLLKVALRRKELFLVYQPIVDLRSGRWIGAEALVRWRRPSGELVRPDLFIQVAEDTGYIQKVTEQVIEIAARDASNIFRKFPYFHIGINLAAADLQSHHTIELLEDLMRETSASDGNILIEATERGFMNTTIAQEIMRKIRAKGIRIAIDDFGTGYSSLSYLESFELDYLKIDKSFVDKIGTEAATSQVVPHIIEMAKDLQLEMIAEGVETEAQARYLRDSGVQFAQGWLFSKPLPYSELQSKLRDLDDSLSGSHPARSSPVAPGQAL
ncbi:EAL domain-containing protein [Hahella chejuensis]|uniref:EAL domain-containing protein n=1 Tax=Hahella chejuensis TaxID=158327 RepID=UPI00030B32E7|nr:EAL domain-containing protein [Hahella chejuensis]